MQNKEKAKYFEALELVDWKSKSTSSATCSVASGEEKAGEEGFNELLAKWQNCSACPLGATRLNLVPGSGSLQAKVMIIGEAPGENEDKQGLPFVGRAGRLLSSLLRAINLDRSEVFITNVLKCRPPHNRDPLPSEVAQCKSFLLEQIKLIKPKLLVALGRIAAQLLLNNASDMKTLRGAFHIYAPTSTPLLVTYHPAYLLRSPSEKAKAYEDFLKIKHHLR